MDSRSCEGARIIQLSGEYDVERERLLVKELAANRESPCRLVVLEMSEVIYLDSIAVSRIRAFEERARAHGNSVRIVATKPHVKRILSMLGLDSLGPVFDSVEEALAAGSPAP